MSLFELLLIKKPLRHIETNFEQYMDIFNHTNAFNKAQNIEI